MKAALLARLDSLFRPLAVQFPPSFVVRRYSHGRDLFLKLFIQERPAIYIPPMREKRILWDIPFRSAIMNAAGMFKNGEGYETVARQGAGAYLAGTTTTYPRSGNQKAGIRHPFVPYPHSGAASNWLGLPNKGHEFVAQRLASLERVNGCPVGISIMSAPESSGVQALVELVEGMKMYDKAGVDFIEMNESCPNAGHSSEGLVERLEYISTAFLKNRQRRLPVIVKFSTDTQLERLPFLLDLLFTLGFDGVNFGNTSTAYVAHRQAIDAHERKMYDYFISTFGGGVSGRPLNSYSLHLAQSAVTYRDAHIPSQEFHIIRTGGIESRTDLLTSEQAGIALCQWYTGYFEAFARYGHQVYKALLAE